jgi:hypothetical protein
MRGFGLLTGRAGDDGQKRSFNIFGDGIDEGMLANWLDLLARRIERGSMA